ncbi:pimeloyl-ACP methyl ester carboxylesterase [Leucobacter exalbidus]|uniref:Pimeloyl-ACP methyl ester carboxylesterase n=1 Tax=Leucobacter exalbidus TaxID=662960 RepID=A0A940PTY7_9MICO|nr:alpha/beta hydrolase [Leucobacter exalbidus]MBP1326165.1 pimeloyl-ACP methyl ester carboxylesterase [Leucobacter exalbidus]
MKSAGALTLPRDLSGGRSLPLAYVRSGPRSGPPVLVIPGGPGLGSVMPYQRFRAVAAKQGIDVLMVEHRGVGLSRKASDGHDLRPTDITVEEVLADLVAVLDAENIEQILVYGASYGSYLAAAFGARYPDRVSGMILDSPMLDAQGRHDTARSLNDLYWHGTAETSEHASRLRALIQRGTVSVEDTGFPVQLLHEAGGPHLVMSMLNLLERGKGARVWSWLNRLGTSDVMKPRPFLMEFDLVAHCAFTELGFGLPHDAELGPLRSDASFAALSEEWPPFEREPVDVRGALPHFNWPMLVLSGDRDLRTPRSVAEQVVQAAPHATLVPIKDHGHSALDTAQLLALQAISHLSMDPTASPSILSTLSGSRPMMARLISIRIMIAKMLPQRRS